MRIIVYDCEVFAHDFLFVFKEAGGDFLCVSHNNNDEITQFMAQDDICLCGFNCKHYDTFILSAVLDGATPEQVKDINDYIISDGGNGWEHPFIRKHRHYFDSFDLMDDTQKGTSLKSIEAHLGMDIEETEVDFDIQRSLTTDELERTIKYCKHDVEATERLLWVRKNYLQTKLNLGKRAGISAPDALAMTNAKLTAAMLHAERHEWYDGREYEYPDKLDLSCIPYQVLDFFDTIHDYSISDEALFDTNLEITIGGMLCVYAWGGVHGSLQCYCEEATETRIIQNRDVRGLYPATIELFNYLSRNVPDPQLFYDIRRERMEAKGSGNKQLAGDLKLPLNTVSGAQENQYNDLYDPLRARSLRITGQLFVTVLVVRLVKACKTIKLLNLNTDGVAYSVEKSELPIVDKICADWEKETGYELDIDNISKIRIKDVNNLLIIKTNGDVKTVGAYLNYGISTKGAFAINNNATIAKQAVIDYFVEGVPIEETIGNCTDIFQFQIVAKASQKYSHVYQDINGENIPAQRCNRVYATKDDRLGTLYKVHKETGVVAKISDLPDHCIVDNKNELTIEDIDKQFYIDLARKYIDAFTGVSKNKAKKQSKKSTEELTTMASTKTKTESESTGKPETVAEPNIKEMNVWERLLCARADFSAANVKKTGEHKSPHFWYFTLNDIVPVAIPICKKNRILIHMTFENNTAVGTVINIDDPADIIVFRSPLSEIESIESNNGKRLTNSMQDIGSIETYSRRYLYLVILDIAVHDDIDGNVDENENGVAIGLIVPDSPQAPVGAEGRKEIVGTLTNVNGQATAEQLEALKTACGKWRELSPDCDEVLQKIALETNGFTATTKEICENLLIKIGETIAALEANNV